MTNKPRAGVDLNDDANHKMFKDALDQCVKDKDYLKSAERSFVFDLSESYNMVGREFSPTVKQFNWLRQIAWDLVK